MTLDLTTAVTHRLDFIDRCLEDPRMTGVLATSIRTDRTAEKQRLLTLHSYLLKSTAVILHQF